MHAPQGRVVRVGNDPLVRDRLMPGSASTTAPPRLRAELLMQSACADRVEPVAYRGRSPLPLVATGIGEEKPLESILADDIGQFHQPDACASRSIDAISITATIAFTGVYCSGPARCAVACRTNRTGAGSAGS